jgi:hypothetical protein
LFSGNQFNLISLIDFLRFITKNLFKEEDL